jgi:hypothetical protein
VTGRGGFLAKKEVEKSLAPTTEITRKFGKRGYKKLENPEEKIEKPITEDFEELLSDTRPVNIPVRGTPLLEILDGFTPAKRKYLCLRMLGIRQAEAERLIDRKNGKVYAWRSHSPQFAAVEAYLLQNRDEYRPQALDVYLDTISTNALLGIANMVEKITDWDDLKKEDKPYVWEACKLVSSLTGIKDKRAPSNKDSRPKTYEEFIHSMNEPKQLKTGE